MRKRDTIMQSSDIQPLVNYYHWKIKQVNLNFKRYLFNRINWDARIIGIKGEVNVCGVKVSGEYVVGGKYEMQITIYSCEASNENCCIKMGSYYGEHKLS